MCLAIGPVTRKVRYVSFHPPSILEAVPGTTCRVTHPTIIIWCMGHIYDNLSRL
eukprot:jgi/Botrbrau1/18538/Bobra.0598s0002.1